MRIAVMQPYLLPYIGYFALIEKVDTFVIFDDVQYIQRGWINRNRIPAQNAEGWIYIQIPVQKASRATKINEMRISYDQDWQDKLKKTIQQNYAKCRYYGQVLPLLTPLWRKEPFIIDPIEETLRNFCEYLEIRTQWIRSSRLGMGAPREGEGEDRGQRLILEICQKLGADEYWNLPGGAGLYSPEDFRKEGITLRFVAPLEAARWSSQFPNLSFYSILDLVMKDSGETVRQIIDTAFAP